MDELDQQVRILQRLRELAADSVAAAAKDKVSATASGKDGFSIKSADGKYAVRLKGLVQADGRFFLSDSAFPVTNTFFLRRARPILEATVGKYLEFRLQPDFGQGTTVLFDAYTDVKVSPAFAVRVGKFKTAGGSRAPAVGERHRVRRAGAGHQPRAQPRRRPSAFGRHRDRRLHLRGRGVQRRARSRQRRRRRQRCEGLRRAGSSSSRSRPAPSRASASASPGAPASSAGPRRRRSSRATARRVSRPGSATCSSTTTPANNVFADGTRQRLAPQAYWYNGPLGLHGRVHPLVAGSDARRVSRTQAPAHGVADHGLVLPHRREELVEERDAQEGRSIPRPAPSARSSSPRGTASSASTTPRSRRSPTPPARPARPRRGRWASTGIWPRPSRSCVDYEHTTFDGGTATGDDREPENFVVTRVQHSF